MVILYWGEWRGTERLLWHPRGGYLRLEDVLPPRLRAELPGIKRPSIWAEEVAARAHVWSLLPVATGTFLGSGRLSMSELCRAAQQEFKLLPGVDALIENYLSGAIP